ncbi:MAG: HAD-IIA family hydrolase [Candidatus Dadabacteria bacterium]|nr:HAD-IIA family hydrolase [Candidatus Dadabacteria bacterium]NIQ13414.1 HAD-IIA family hydrolase [Candidatus Dadabacteria bacterium]
MELRKKGKDILFITNNPSRSPSEYKKKLNTLNIYSKLSEFITSPMAVNYYLNKKYKNLGDKSAFIIGSNYLKKEVKKSGIKSVKGKKAYNSDLTIMGGHNKFNFEEIKTATISIRNGSDFIATNKDLFYPTENGLSPATGALLASIEAASQSNAVIVGKPEKYIFEILKTHKIKLKRTLLIGDSLNTDILGGKNAGFKTALALTGNTNTNDLKKSEIKPDYVINDLSQLINQHDPNI